MKRRVNRGASQSRSTSLPTATDGWVTIKNLGQMKPTEAIVLDNWFPLETEIKIRQGSSVHGTGLGGSVDTTFGYSGHTADKLLAAANGKIWDVTAAGAGTQLATAFTSNRWQNINFSTDGGNFALLANGADGPQTFDGAAVTTSNLTGNDLVTTKLVQPFAFKERIFYVEKDSLAFWYHTSVRQISGELSRVNLGGVFRLGGYLQAGATWTRDGGSGIDDYAVFITSNGEVAIYQGDDPGDASRWALVGVYRVGAPLGRRCWMKYANDLALITQDGIVPMGSVLSRDRTGLSMEALSANISPTFTSVAKNYQANFGWSGMLYPNGRMAIFNIPTTTATYQYILNTNTRAWCRFTGLAATSWGLSANVPYFGTAAGVVMKFDDGLTDNDAAVSAQYKSSFQYFGNRNEFKHFKMVRPVFRSDANINFGYGVDTDFNDTTIDFETGGSGAGTQWDEGLWDQFQWSGGNNTFQNWQGADGTGRCGSIKIAINNSEYQISHLSTDWVWEEGGIL